MSRLERISMDAGIGALYESHVLICLLDSYTCMQKLLLTFPFTVLPERFQLAVKQYIFRNLQVGILHRYRCVRRCSDDRVA